jgi:hypothetical protein
MNKRNNWNQTQLEILDIGEEILHQENKRRYYHHKKNTLFDRNQLSISDLDKITFEISDKDFEFFYSHYLHDCWYDAEVSKDKYAKEDIRAQKDGKLYLIQCKQWANLSIGRKEVCEMFMKLEDEYLKNPWKAIIRIVTTSFFDDEAKKFMKEKGIQGVNNIDLVKICRENTYFSKEKWKAIRLEIYKKRAERIWGIAPLMKLRRARFEELKHHLSPDKRESKFRTSSPQSQKFLSRYYQYWNLV